MKSDDGSSNKRPKHDNPTYPTSTGSSVTATTRVPTYLNQLILGMSDCLERLDAKNITFESLETMAILIHESMSNVSRHYHSVQHVFDISKDLTDPLAILSAYFHDCIYYHLDGGLNPKQTKCLKGTYRLDDASRYTFFATQTRHDEDELDQTLKLVECIFGYTPGEEITTRNGLNEFLSAVVAVRELRIHLTMEQLAQIACCIECTIPFRNRDLETGLLPPEQLCRNLKKAQKNFDLSFTDGEVIQSVQRAVILSNKDVGNFCTTDRVYFLDNSWSLLDESNPSLRQQYLYSVKEFQHAIYNLYGFFGFLLPSLVFGSFDGVPSPEEVDEMTRQCQINLQIGKKYVGAKLLAVSVLAAFAELTGGDAPISLFMGDLPSCGHFSQGLTDFLKCPPPKSNEIERYDPTVYSILSIGRRSETSFDIRQSPLAAYLYAYLGDDGIQGLVSSCNLYPIEKEEARSLLASIPREALDVVSESISKVAISRADKIRAIVRNLGSESEDGRR